MLDIVLPVDDTGRLFHESKTAISAELADIPARLRAIALHFVFPGAQGPNGARGR